MYGTCDARVQNNEELAALRTKILKITTKGVTSASIAEEILARSLYIYDAGVYRRDIGASSSAVSIGLISTVRFFVCEPS